MRLTTAAALLCLPGFLAAPCVAGQRPALPPPVPALPLPPPSTPSPAPPSAEVNAPTTLTTRSSLVLAPALVRTKSGELVFTLGANDFALTDDGVLQNLSLDEDTDAEPLALVVVIESGGAGAREFGKLSSLASNIGSIAGGGKHRVAVVSFDSEPKLVQEFTPDADAATAAVREVVHAGERGDSGADNGAAILDSLGFAVDLLRQQPPQSRRAILLISETLDRGSHIKLEDAVRAVSDTNTAIYSIAYSTARSEAAHYSNQNLPTQRGVNAPSSSQGGFGVQFGNPNPFPPTGCMGKDPHPDPDATTSTAARLYDCAGQMLPPLLYAKWAAIFIARELQRNVPETVARLTGGEYFTLTDDKRLQKTLATIANHVPNRYVLSFQPQSPHPGLHALRLTLKDYPDLKITARTNYWVDEAATTAQQ